MDPAAPHPVRRRGGGRRLLLAGALGVAGAVAVVTLVTVVAGSGDVQSNFVREEFVVDRTERLAAEIAEDGPLLLPDAGPGRSKDVYIQHVGPGTNRGWLAFAARAPGASRECTLRWDGDGEVFVDPCTGVVVPPDGGSLPQYRTRVDKGRLYVDLRTTLSGADGSGGGQAG